MSLPNHALRDRDEELFRLFYFVLIAYFSPFLSVSRKKKRRKEGVSFEEFLAFDSTTITLFSAIMKGVGRNPKGDGKKKGGLMVIEPVVIELVVIELVEMSKCRNKVHMLTDVHADTPQFVTISEAKMHDKNFLRYLNLSAGSMMVIELVEILYLTRLTITTFNLPNGQKQA